MLYHCYWADLRPTLCFLHFCVEIIAMFYLELRSGVLVKHIPLWWLFNFSCCLYKNMCKLFFGNLSEHCFWCCPSRRGVQCLGALAWDHVVSRCVEPSGKQVLSALTDCRGNWRVQLKPPSSVEIPKYHKTVESFGWKGPVEVCSLTLLQWAGTSDLLL